MSTQNQSGLVDVTIRIYDLNGRLVKTVLEEDMPLGEYQTLWDGKNFDNEVVASGTYIVKLVAGNFKAIKKIVVIK